MARRGAEQEQSDLDDLLGRAEELSLGGDPLSALPIATEVADLARAAGDGVRLARAVYRTAVAYANAGRVGDGIDHAVHALVLARETGDGALIVRAHGLTASTLLESGKLSRGVEVLAAGIRAAERVVGDSVDLAAGLHMLASAYMMLGGYDEAVALEGRAYAIDTQIGAHIDQLFARYNRGELYLQWALRIAPTEPQRAAELFAEAEAVALAVAEQTASGEATFIVDSLVVAGTAATRLGRHEEAVVRLEQAIESATGDEPWTLGTALVALGEALIELDRPRDATPCLDRGLEIVGRLSDTPTRLRGHRARSRARELAGDVAGSLADARAAYELLEARSRSEHDELVATVRARVQLAATEESRDAFRTAADVDPLTGVLNRRRFDELLAARTPTTGLVLIDIDHFKTINDRYGHVAGDEVLRRIATAIGTAVRSHSDVAARLGGDEFALLIEQTSEHAITDVCARVRAAIGEVRTGDVAPGLALTVSIGAATGQRELYERADGALYSVKRDGRDGIRLADAP